MRIYVAAYVAERSRVRAAYAAVVASGHDLSLDWLSQIPEDSTTSDATLDDATALAAAAEDLAAIWSSDALWLLAPERGGTGCLVETGYALALGIPVIVSGLAWRRSIFFQLASRRFAHDHDVAEFLRKWPT